MQPTVRTKHTSNYDSAQKNARARINTKDVTQGVRWKIASIVEARCHLSHVMRQKKEKNDMESKGPHAQSGRSASSRTCPRMLPIRFGHPGSPAPASAGSQARRKRLNETTHHHAVAPNTVGLLTKKRPVGDPQQFSRHDRTSDGWMFQTPPHRDLKCRQSRLVHAAWANEKKDTSPHPGALGRPTERCSRPGH